MKNERSDYRVIGWREWVGLPDLGIKSIKAKVDTGARSSSLHAFELEQHEQGGVTRVKFQVYPFQRRSEGAVYVEASVLEFRSIRSSSGHAEIRPVIITDVELLGQKWPIELTLTSRDQMGFRMLLGREAFRGRFLVDAGKSFYDKRRKKDLKEGFR